MGVAILSRRSIVQSAAVASGSGDEAEGRCVVPLFNWPTSNPAMELTTLAVV